MKSGKEMSHKELVDYVKSNESIFKSRTEALQLLENDDNLLSIPFCVCYEQLLKDRMNFCLVCSEYYRAMYDKSFWFMKPLVMRRARKYESIHYETLGRFMLVNLYKRKLYDDGQKESERRCASSCMS